MTINTDLNTVTKAIQGSLYGESVAFLGVSTDSRKIARGSLFVALRGERFDGHEFVEEAVGLGAVAAVVDKVWYESVSHTANMPPLVVVGDTREALGLLAKYWRQQFSIPLVAVTGSNGKTTSKEMLASIFEAAFGQHVLVTQGNFNNEIGLPLTLLSLGGHDEAAVIEMGMSHPGEIASLAAIAVPDIALVTNAQRAHLAGMGSVESVAREKGTLFSALPSGGIAIMNVDEPWGDVWSQQIGSRPVVTYGLEQAADVSGQLHMHGLESRLTIRCEAGVSEINLAVPGAHNAVNALGAAAAAMAAGLTLDQVVQGLSAFKGVKGRLQRKSGVSGALILDDTYNANPDSVCAAIDVLAATIGKKILVLGDMGEIGDMSAQFHDEVGGYAKSQGIDRLLALGNLSTVAARNFGEGGEHFKHRDDLIQVLQREMGPTVTVLVKGSRFMKMEQVVEAIGELCSEPNGQEKKACC